VGKEARDERRDSFNRIPGHRRVDEVQPALPQSVEIIP
jgi:hypothetical protein